MRMFKWATVFLAVWMLAACSTTTQQKIVSVGKPEKIEPLPSSYSEFSSKQIEEDAREFARILSQDHLGKYYTPLAQNKIKLVVKRNPEDNLKVYQERFTRSFQGALNKWVREFLPPEKYGEFFLALNDDLSDRKFNNLNDVQEIEEDPVTKLKYVGFIILEFLNGKTGDGTTKEFEASFIPLDYERTGLAPMNFSKLWIPEHLRLDVRCRKGSFCDPFVVEKDNPSNIGLYYTDTFCSTFHFPNPTKGYILNFKGIQPNTAKIFQLLLENKLECMGIVVNDSTLKDVYKWEEAADRLGFFRDENSSPKATPTVLFEGTGVSMGSKTYFTIRMIYWNQEKAGQVARNTSQDIYLIENNSQKLTVKFRPYLVYVDYDNGKFITDTEGPSIVAEGCFKDSETFRFKIEVSEPLFVYVINTDSHRQGGPLYPNPTMEMEFGQKLKAKIIHTFPPINVAPYRANRAKDKTVTETIKVIGSKVRLKPLENIMKKTLRDNSVSKQELSNAEELNRYFRGVSKNGMDFYLNLTYSHINKNDNCRQ